MDSKIVIFGAGANGVKTMKALREFEAKADFFCDNDSKKWGSFIEDIPVISADELRKLTKSMKVRVIVSVSASHELEIREQLKDYDLEYYHIPQWIYMNGFYKEEVLEENQEKIKLLKSMMRDEYSLRVLDAVLSARENENDEPLGSIVSDRKKQYIPSDIFDLNSIKVIVDAGAFDGDSAKIFLAETGAEKVYSFEPDPENYKELFRNIEESEDMKGVIPVNKGIGEKNDWIRFSSGYNIGSHFDKQGSLSCEVVTLDAFFEKKEKVDLIKMDIEGFEREALLGAQEIIKRDKPNLAICLYHKPADLWELPLLVHEILPEYQFYIRHYSLGLTETVLYAKI